jgi:hypothetical protein
MRQAVCPFGRAARRIRGRCGGGATAARGGPQPGNPNSFAEAVAKVSEARPEQRRNQGAVPAAG